MTIYVRPHGMTEHDPFRRKDDAPKPLRIALNFRDPWSGQPELEAMVEQIVQALLHGRFDVDVEEYNYATKERHVVRYQLTAPVNVRREWHESGDYEPA